jgi:hypothetical protein
MFDQIHGTQIAMHCIFPKLYCAVANNMCDFFELQINTHCYVIGVLFHILSHVIAPCEILLEAIMKDSTITSVSLLRWPERYLFFHVTPFLC